MSYRRTNDGSSREIEGSTAGATSPGDHGKWPWPIHSLGLLAIFLGGSEDSFTGLLLQLIAKADAWNRAKIRLAFPREVMAWEIWMAMDPAPTAYELARKISEEQE